MTDEATDRAMAADREHTLWFPVSALLSDRVIARQETLGADLRAALARDLGLPAIHAVEADLRLAARPRGEVALAGRITARVTQRCVVTLEPFDSAMDTTLDLVFSPDPERWDLPPLAEGEERSLDDPDPAEPLLGGRIDLFAVIREHLALAIDPYPRSPGAAFEGVATDDAGAAASPFAALARLRSDGETA